MADSYSPETERRGTSREAVLRRKLYRVLSWSEQQGSGVATLSSRGERLGDLLVSHGRPFLAIPARPCERAAELDAGLASLIGASSRAGGFSAAVRRQESLEQTRRSLLALAAADLVCLLGAAGEEALDAALRPAQDDYDPRLTFSAGELCIAALARAVGPLDPLSADLVRTAECSTMLVLARHGRVDEVPFPIAMHGLADVPLREVFRLSRVAFEMCGAAEDGQELGVVTLGDENEAWHYVTGPTRLVAVSAPPALAPMALSRAVRVASAA